MSKRKYRKNPDYYYYLMLKLINFVIYIDGPARYKEFSHILAFKSANNDDNCDDCGQPYSRLYL